MSIGGNQILELQTATESRNAIGERVQQWQTVHRLRGFLDLMSGTADRSDHVKLVGATHVFIADYCPLPVSAETCRAVVNGQAFDVLYLDDPMSLHDHWEIQLRQAGDDRGR